MKIRLAKDKDCVAIARLHRRTIRKVNSKDYPKDIIDVWSARTSAERFRNSQDNCKRWVAVQGDKVVGFCDHGLNGEFWGLYVHKDYIGKGIGSQLLKTAENSLKKFGYKKTTLKATVTAKNFYKKYGYKIIKKSFHLVGDKKLPIFIMTKKIS